MAEIRMFALGLLLLQSTQGIGQSGAATKGGVTTKPEVGNIVTEAQGAVQKNKNFDIFGVDPRTKYSGEFLIANKKCKIKGIDEEYCYRGFDGPPISDVPIFNFFVLFNDGKIYSVSGSSAASNFTRVTEAFQAKYGKPVKIENVPWRNRAGATFDNVKMTWAFQEGSLELVSRGNKIDEMQFSFISGDNAPQKPAPTVNF